MSQQFFNLDALRLPRFVINGPFILDGMESAAYINGKQLDLSEEEYNTLYLLVEREGFFVPFGQLYKAAWEKFDGRNRCVEAREGLKNINRQLHVNKGNGARIGYNFLRGFTFQTKIKKSKSKYIAAAALTVCVIFFTIINITKIVSPESAVYFINEQTPLSPAELNETDVKKPEHTEANDPSVRRTGKGPHIRTGRTGFEMTY